MEKKKHRWKRGRGIIIKKMSTIPAILTVPLIVTVPLILAGFLSPFGHAQTPIYSWRDRAGTVHIVNDLNKVPHYYRKDMKIYRIPSTRGAREPQSKVSSKPVAEMKAGGEETLEGESRGEKMAELRGSITALEERLEELRQGRETKRIRMIRKRASGKTVYREEREIDEIGREIEILEDQLGKKMEVLRSLEQEESHQGGP